MDTVQKRRDNYALSRDRAQELFVSYDQQRLIERWQLRNDGQFLYADFFGRPYRICRKTGTVTRDWDQQQAGFEEVLTLFDLLCHKGHKCAAHTYAPVNSLRGKPVAAGVGTDFFSASARVFDRDPAGFGAACEHLGGEKVTAGDIGYRFAVFADLTLIVKFYHSDGEFPASLTVLWDENTLQYLLYETVYYAQGFLLGQLREWMEQR